MLEKSKMELVMDVAVERVVNKEVAKVVEEVNKELVMDVVVEGVNRELKEFNEGLVKVYLCKVKKIMWSLM